MMTKVTGWLEDNWDPDITIEVVGPARHVRLGVPALPASGMAGAHREDGIRVQQAIGRFGIGPADGARHAARGTDDRGARHR
jgi:hypothetical protein